MKRFVAGLAILMCLASVFAGGGKEKASGKQVLDVIISQYGNYTKEWWTEFEANFEAANPAIDLNIEIVSWNDIYSVVTTRISTGEQPDILNISGFADYVADDLLMPAEEYTSAAVKAQIIPSFWNSNEMDGTVWALPILASCRALFYNVDLLNAAGITSAPKTWDDVLAACEAIRATHGSSVTPWALDISTDEGQAAFSYYSWNFGGGYVDAAGNWKLDSAENVQAVEYIKKLIDSGYVNAGPYTDTRYPLQDGFSAGTVAMMIGPMNMVSADSTVNYGVADIPGKGVGLGVCDQLMVFKDAKAADQAARTAAISKFFDAFYECETYSDYMVFEGFLPATLDGSDYLAKNAEKHTVGGSTKTGDSEYFATFCAVLPTCQFYPMQKAEWMDVRNGVIDVEQKVGQGLISAKDALSALQAQVTK
ncbi:MAG: extracellular solute-binding protein [Spirochaetaceae bacterium]|nr:extracellular solute-binding protein [Spirochaetaceae bacterium]